MKKQDIVETADQLTEKKGSHLDIELLLNLRLQKFCQEHRFWWRKKTFSFNTAIGTQTYDVSDNGTGCIPALAGIEMEEVTKVLLVSSPTQVTELDAITDDQTIAEMIEGTDTGQPNRYTIDPGSTQTIRVDTPDAIYKLRTIAWCLPVISDSTSGSDVPLVPNGLHNVLVDGLRMDIFESLYGTQNSKYVTARNEYMAGVERAKKKTRFTTSQLGVPEFRSYAEAIRSS